MNGCLSVTPIERTGTYAGSRKLREQVVYRLACNLAAVAEASIADTGNLRSIDHTDRVQRLGLLECARTYIIFTFSEVYIAFLRVGAVAARAAQPGVYAVTFGLRAEGCLADIAGTVAINKLQLFQPPCLGKGFLGNAGDSCRNFQLAKCLIAMVERAFLDGVARIVGQNVVVHRLCGERRAPVECALTDGSNAFWGALNIKVLECLTVVECFCPNARQGC